MGNITFVLTIQPVYSFAPCKRVTICYIIQVDQIDIILCTLHINLCAQMKNYETIQYKWKWSNTVMFFMLHVITEHKIVNFEFTGWV